MKKLGFGCMRLPKDENGVDYSEFSKMIDVFMERGFTYFDTAYVYHEKKSEIALRECLVKRYPRESFQIADKMPPWDLKKPEDLENTFNEQLEKCGVEYFDYYLMHNMNRDTYPTMKSLGGFEFAKKMKEEGKIKNLGFSFHDSAEFLEMVIKENPGMDFVQLQLNFIDMENPQVQSRACYEVLEKYNLPAIVMEPIRGGSLCNIPTEAEAIYKELGDSSAASYAIRFAASFPLVFMVLSGMSTMEQLLDNTNYMQDFKPLTDIERAAIDKVAEILKAYKTVPCTECGYCLEGCPKKINIPKLFDCYNRVRAYGDYDEIKKDYSKYTENAGKASDCIKCGLCEGHCPQHIEIREKLSDVSKMFDKE